MRNKNNDDWSVDELEQLLYRKKRNLRRQRLQRLKEAGRVVDVAGLPPPHPQPPPLVRPTAVATGAMRQLLPDNADDETPLPGSAVNGQRRGRWLLNKALLLVEIAAVVGLGVVLLSLWQAQRDLNQELTAVQRVEVAGLALPTAAPTPVIDLVVLPTGHRFIDGRSPEPVESGDIPAHLLPAIQAYQPPPIPTPGPEQARVIQIPAINVHASIVEGVYDWEQLKRGVGHHIGSAQPGQLGNMVLAAHNDIYGEIFRDLDKLKPGDEIIVTTDQRTYTYVVTKLEVVEPTDVQVMDATNYASTTLISCYPYRINTKRIVVLADLKSDASS
jgi:sortase A